MLNCAKVDTNTLAIGILIFRLEARVTCSLTVGSLGTILGLSSRTLTGLAGVSQVYFGDLPILGIQVRFALDRSALFSFD